MVKITYYIYSHTEIVLMDLTLISELFIVAFLSIVIRVKKQEE